MNAISGIKVENNWAQAEKESWRLRSVFLPELGPLQRGAWALSSSNIPEKFFKDSNNLVLVHTMGLQEVHWSKNISCFKFDIFLCWKILKGLDLHKIEPLFLEISVGGNLVLSISQRLFSGSLPLMKPCISIEGKRKHCLLTHLQSWAKWLVNQTSTTVLVWFF